MKKLFIITALISCFLLTPLNVIAQEIGNQWITYPQPDDSSQVWFRRTFVTQKRPKNARLAIASPGYIQVFINERNVSRDVLFSYPHQEGTDFSLMTVNISRYLRNDSNTIAVWYAPNPALETDKQLSLCYFGTNSKGKPFASYADGTWYCKKACGWANDSIEVYDATKYDKEWKWTTTNLSSWVHPFGSTDQKKYRMSEKTNYYEAYHRTATYSPTRTTTSKDTITYTFPKPFDGWIRLTIRNAKAGQKINIGEFVYICSGETDEQACRKFTTSRLKEVRIWGKNLKKSMFQNVEGIEIQPYIHTSWQN